MSRAPDELPLLGRGRHTSARDGACLMEYTSVVAGLRFSDHPRCTAPTLATLARLVNDATSDQARPRLSRWAPDLAGRPQLSAQQSATVVADVLSAVADALEQQEPAPLGGRLRVRRLRRQAGRERTRAAAAGPWVHLGEALHRAGAARLRLEGAIRSLDAVDVPTRDRVLAAVLAGALAPEGRARVRDGRPGALQAMPAD